MIFNVKNNYKKRKKGGIFARDPHGCDVARKATWQHHAGPRGAYAARCDVYIIYTLLLRVIVHISIPYSELTNPS